MFKKPLTAIALATGIAGAGILVLPALAEDHPCVQPQDQFVVALCSDPELRAIADQQRDAMMALWTRLSPEEQRRFRTEQFTWRETTARTCTVDQPLLQPLPVETKNCLRQAEARRIEFLRHYGQTGTPTALHPNAPPQVTSTASVATTDDHGTAVYQEGLRDRAAWEEWFNSLQGDYKTGAFYWSSQRSLPHPGSCKQLNDQFYAGCTEAKVKLSTSDALRKTEPDYKTGWNAWTPQYTSPAHLTSVAGTVDEQCAAVRNGTETSDYWKTRCAHLDTAANGRSENGRDGGGIIQDIAQKEAVQQSPALAPVAVHPPVVAGVSNSNSGTAEGAPLATPSPPTYHGQGRATIEFRGMVA